MNFSEWTKEKKIKKNAGNVGGLKLETKPSLNVGRSKSSGQPLSFGEWTKQRQTSKKQDGESQQRTQRTKNVISDSSVGTAVPSGPPEPTSDDEPDYLSYSQPASNYAAGYQGSLSQSSTPYAPGLQAGFGKKPEQKQAEPAPVEEPEDEFAGMSSQELRTLHDETKTKRDEAGKALGKITISQEENPEGVDQAEVDRVLREYEALQNRADRISARLVNQTGAENLGRAMEEPGSYQSAKDLETDLWKLNTVLNMDLPDEQAQGYARELKEKYGTEDLFGLLPKLTAQQKEAVAGLSEAGVDYEKASAFEEKLERAEEYRERTEKQQKFAEEHPFRASLSTIPATAVQGAEHFDSLLSNWGHNDPDDPDSYIPLDVTEMYATNFVRNVRGTVAKKIEENPAFAGVEIGGQNVGAFLYQTGMSMGDFLFNSFLTGNFTGGLGGTGSEAAKKAAENLSLAIMGSSAAANTTVEAIERGLSNRQAYTLGAVAGAAEIFTERFSLEALLDGSWEKNAVQYVLKNAFTEGSEEVGSDLINLLADVLVAKDQSEWRQSVEAYRQQGLSKEEAFTEAMKDQAVNMGMDFLGGALSGGIMSGSNVALNEIQQYGPETVQTQKTAPTEEAGADYTIQRDAGGDIYVQIDADILKGKPREQWGKTVQDTIKSIFGSGLKLARGTVFTNRKGRGEYTNGSYTKMLERTDPKMYQDKMRMAAGSDGILKSASDVVYEDASHERTDDIVGFNRGKIIVSVKGAGYTGDVLTAVYSDGKETFFDINNLARKTIEATTPERYAVQDGFTQADAAASIPIIPSAGDSVKGKFAPEDGETHYSLKETAQAYEGKDLSKDGSVYGYEFLTSLPDMTVTSLPEVGTIQGKDGRINARTVVNLGMENARKVGVEKDGKVFVRNGYTGKQLYVTPNSIRHGLNGDFKRLLTNARLGTVIGEVIKNAVPINALQNKVEGVTGTYAMAGYATDSRGREFIGIITVEQKTGTVESIEVYDTFHSIGGRQKKSGSQVDTKSQSIHSIKATTISIADLLETVKSTHQSILSEDVLSRLGEKRNPKGDYTGKALFSIKDAEAVSQTATGEGEAGPTRPLTQADAKHFASETGTENGLVLDDYVQKHLRPEKAKQLNTLAKALGVRVRFVNSIRGGTANASIRGNEVQIERYNPNPVTFLLGHELTHRMQQLSPEAYSRFKEAVRSEAEKEAQGLHSLYRIRGEDIDFEGAMDEATANYAGRLLEKGPVLDEFIQRHKTDRSLLEKLLDAVRDMLSKLTGTERKQVETAESKLLEALEETAEKVKKNGEEVTAADSRERYSLNENFSREVDQWLKETTEESRMISHGYFQVGTTSEALKSIGVQDGSIFWRKQKIGYIMLEHPEMDSKTIKQVPELIENPIVVLKSRTQESSIVLLGDVTAKNGERVMAALELTPKKGGGMEAEFTLLSSAYSRTQGNIQNLLKKSEILYLATDKRRTDAWLMQLRVQFPSGQPVRGPIGSISYKNGKVNIKGKTLSELGGIVM